MIPSPFINVSNQLIPPPFVGQGLRNPFEFRKIGIFPQPIRDYALPMKPMKKGGKVMKKK